MGVMIAANWPDLLETDLRKVYMDQYNRLPMVVPDMFNVISTSKPYEKDSGVGDIPDHSEFTGRISVVEPEQAYDKTYTFTEYAAQMQIQRRLKDDDMNRVIMRYPKGLATSANRSKEKKGANVFNLAFTYEPTDGDGAELCASDHDSNVASTASQSNEGTYVFSATNVENVRIAMADFRSDIGEIISVVPDTMILPINLEQTGWETINSKGKVDTAENNPNFHKGRYSMVVWKRLSDSNNWFMTEIEMQKEYNLWFNRIPNEFFQDKDSDTMVGKYLSYYRCGTGWLEWRWLMGQLVS